MVLSFSAGECTPSFMKVVRDAGSQAGLNHQARIDLLPEWTSGLAAKVKKWRAKSMDSSPACGRQGGRSASQGSLALRLTVYFEPVSL